MRPLILAFTLLAVSACTGIGHPVMTGVLDKAELTWEWAQGMGGEVKEFRLYCNAVTDLFSTPIAHYPQPIKPSEARTHAPGLWKFPARKVFSEPGRYLCKVRAWNEAGESEASNQVVLDLVDSQH